MTSINVGKAIYSILINDKEVSKQVNGKIFPLVADETTTYPFIIYLRRGYDNGSNKDGFSDSVNVSLFIVTDNYSDGIKLAENVRKALEGKSYTIDDIKIDDIILDDAAELFNDDGFIQMLSFNILIDK